MQRTSEPDRRLVGYRDSVLLTVLLALAATAWPAAARAQESKGPSEGSSTSVFRMGDSPSLRVGEQFRLDLHVRTQTDVRPNHRTDTIAWGNRRVGVDGALFDRLQFQVERELVDVDPWRDVFVDLRLHRALRVRAGRFKAPFSMERTTSSFDLDFARRSALVTQVAPGRHRGIMVHGRARRRVVEYEVGVFKLDERSDRPAYTAAESTTPVTMTAVRVTTRAVSGLHLGIAITQSRVPEGFYEPTRHFDDAPSSEEFYVKGRRQTIGIEGRWTAGRLVVAGELIRQADSREGLSVSGESLSDLLVHGGYLSGVWRLAGKAGSARRGLDLAVRFDRLAFGSANGSEAPSLSPRSNRVAPLRLDTWTVGTTWLVNRWVKVQANGIREQILDPLNVRAGMPPASWKALVRTQFAM